MQIIDMLTYPVRVAVG